MRGGVDHTQRQLRIAGVQRARILTATCQLCAELGAPELTVSSVVTRAGVSRRTYYELFTSLEECLLAAINQGIAGARSRLLATHDPKAPWREQLRSGLIALLEYFDHEPQLARLLLVDSVGAGREALLLRERTIAELVAFFEQPHPGRARAARLRGLTFIGESLVGGATSILHTRLLDPNHGPLLALTNDLMAILVLPYSGPAAAAAELSHPQPAPAPGKPASGQLADPLKGLPLRLTYRTMRVLLAVDNNPGATNRTVARLADVEDQGQISKLLRRLEGLGLIENYPQPRGRGEANAWRLTDRGRQLCHALGRHAEVGAV